MNITKAIIPVAGWGSRMLPITKAIEKCMLPIGTRPVIDYIVQDVVAAGIKDIYFVVGEQSIQLQRYYGTNTQLNEYLVGKGKTALLELVAPPSDVNMHFITQPKDGDYGTSVPVGLASEFIEDGEAALVIMGDQFYYRRDGGSNAADLMNLVQEKGVSAGLFGVEVPWDEVEKYGVIEKNKDGDYARIVEKPTRDEAPSNLNNASFYIFDKDLFELAKTLPVNPARGEFEVTDAINAYVEHGKKVAVGTVSGEYMECGTPEGWLQANNALATNTATLEN